MGCLSVIVLSALSSTLIFFFGYPLWLMIVLAVLWLAAIVVSALFGHRGFGGGGNVDLNMTVAAAAIAAAFIIPKYNTNTPCGQARSALRALAAAEQEYFAVHKSYTIDMNSLKLKQNPHVYIMMLRGDEQSFMAAASHSACDEGKSGTPRVFSWDSARGGLQ